MIKVGSFALGSAPNDGSSSTNQSITGVGFQPKLVIFWLTKENFFGFPERNEMYWSFGAATGSTARWSNSTSIVNTDPDNAYYEMNLARILKMAAPDDASAIRGESDFVSMDADGFTITNYFNIDLGTITVNYMALGGANISAAVGNGAHVGGTGNKVFTGTGFTPKALILTSMGDQTFTGPVGGTDAIFGIGMATGTSSQGAIYNNHVDSSPGDVKSIQLSDAVSVMINSSGTVTKKAVLASFDSDGFTINYTTNTANGIRHCWIAIGGAAEFSFDTLTANTTTGAQAETGVGHKPQGLLMMSNGFAASAAFQNGSLLTVGAGSALSNGSGIANVSAGYNDPDNVSSADTPDAYMTASSVFAVADGGTTALSAASLSSIENDGYTLNWTANDGVARSIMALSIGMPPPLVLTLSVTAASASVATSNIGMMLTRRLATTPASALVDLNDVGMRISRRLAVTAAGALVSTVATDMLVSRRLAAVVAEFEAQGHSVGMAITRRLGVTKMEVSVDPNDIGLLISRILSVTSASASVDTSDVGMLRNLLLQVSAGGVAVDTSEATLLLSRILSATSAGVAVDTAGVNMLIHRLLSMSTEPVVVETSDVGMEISGPGQLVLTITPMRVLVTTSSVTMTRSDDQSSGSGGLMIFKRKGRR